MRRVEGRSAPHRARAARLAAAVALVALALLLPSPAAAHTSLVGSSPADGDNSAEVPAQVVLEFSQDLAPPAQVVVTAPGGRSATAGPPAVAGAVVTQPLRDGPEGTYTVAYRAVSADGHQVTGQLRFTVGSGSPAPSPSGSAGATPAPETAGPRPEEPVRSRRTVAVVVGVGLFAGAALLALLARRSPP